MDLTHLLNLETNWDSYGAESIAEVAVDTAMALVTCVTAATATAVPTGGGGVQLNWTTPFGDLEVVVGKDGILQADFLKLK